MTENLAARGEGLAGLAKRWRIEIGKCCPVLLKDANSNFADSSCRQQLRDVEELEAEIAALEAAAPPSTGFVVSGEPLSEAESRWLKASAAALATPSPQAPQEQCNAFSPTSAREQSLATASDGFNVGDEVDFGSWWQRYVRWSHRTKTEMSSIDLAHEAWIAGRRALGITPAATQEQPAPQLKCCCQPLHSTDCPFRDVRSYSYRGFNEFEQPPQVEEGLRRFARGLASRWLGKDKVTLDGISVPRDHDAHVARAQCAEELVAWADHMATAAPNQPAGSGAKTDLELARGVRAHVLNDWQGERVEREVIKALEIVRAETVATVLKPGSPRKVGEDALAKEIAADLEDAGLVEPGLCGIKAMEIIASRLRSSSKGAQ